MQNPLDGVFAKCAIGEGCFALMQTVMDAKLASMGPLETRGTMPGKSSEQ